MAITNMDLKTIAKTIALGFYRKATWIKGISTRYDPEVQIQGFNGIAIKVPLVNGGAVKTFVSATGYEAADPNIEGIDLPLDKRIYVPTSWGALAAMQAGGVERYKDKLAADGAAIANAVWGTFATLFESAAVTTSHEVAAATFDVDDVADLGERARKINDGANWTLLVSDALYTNLLKDERVSKAANYGSDEALKKGILPTLFGLSIAPIASGGASLGYLVNSAAAAFGSAPIIPSLPSESAMVERRLPLIDPDTGLAFIQKTFYDPQKDTGHQILELFYGAKLVQPNGVIKVVAEAGGE